jgi:arylsulfatase A-like enzyme
VLSGRARLAAAERAALWLLAVSVAGCSGGGVGEPSGAAGSTSGPRHNILILVADDLGVDGVGAYGEAAEPPPTPNLDALAARGVLFRNAWANPVCSPTRAAIMTGRYSFRTGIGSARRPDSESLDPAETIIPEAFDAAGSPYSHAMIGKWHLGEGPTGPGPAGWGWVVEGPVLLVRDFYRWPRTVNGETSPSTTYLTTQQVDDALDWIGRQQGPWLCYLSFYAPHGPWMKPPSGLHTRDLSGIEHLRHSPGYFKAMVEALDTEIGRLFDGLGDALDRTHVVFVGDNGTEWAVTEPPFVRDHGKGTPYEGGVNVPLIIAGPAVRSPGREEEALVSAVDLFASVLELGGVDPATALDPRRPIDSVSLVPYLRHLDQPPLRSTVFAERFENREWRRMDSVGLATVRDERFKLIRFFVHSRDELYDLEADPWERHDLLADGGEARLTAEQRAAYRALSDEIARLRSSATFGAELGQAAD